MTTICAALVAAVVVLLGGARPAMAHSGPHNHVSAVEATEHPGTQNRRDLVLRAAGDAGHRNSADAVIETNALSLASGGSTDQASFLECCCVGMLCHAGVAPLDGSPGSFDYLVGEIVRPPAATGVHARLLSRIERPPRHASMR